jgi:predicted enzyme related to lactoylglutathione lyase
MRNTVNWFEIFVSDFGRAVAFYEKLFEVELKKEIFEGLENAIFPAHEDAVTGALVKHPTRRPLPDGTLVYLNAGGKLDALLGRVAALGGEVVMPKRDIGEPGFIALIRDTEGNVVGLHAPR